MRVIGAVATLLALAAVLAAAQPSQSASSSVTITANLLSSTDIDTAGCATGVAGRSDFGALQPGTSSVTSTDCDVAFGSSNDNAQLQVRQSDGAGQAMWMPTTGALDATFDGPSGTGDGRVILTTTAFDSYGYSVTVLPDGRTLVGGECATGNPYPNLFCLTMLLPNGTLDTSFDGPSGTGNGTFTFAQGSQGSDWLKRVIVQPDGKILASGECLTGTAHYMCVTRLNANGSYDLTFDGPSGTGNGRVGVDNGDEAWSYGMALQDDGKIVLAGKCLVGSYNDFCVARLNGADGTLDTTFDGPSGTGNGIFSFPIGTSHDDGGVVLVQPDGRIVVGGACFVGANSQPCFARLNTDGSFDTAFDGPSGSGNGRFTTTGGTYDDALYDVLLQPDGNLVFAGFCDGVTNDACLLRLLPTGALDPAFDGPSGTGNGLVTIVDNAGNEDMGNVRLQPDGRLIGVGTCGATSAMCVTRLNADGTLDTRFRGPAGVSAGNAQYPIGTGDGGAVGAGFASDGRLVMAGGCRNGSAVYRICVQRLDTGARVSDYSNLGSGSDTDWASSSTTTNSFGACVRATAGGATSSWPTTGTCSATDGTNWNAIPTIDTTIATTSAPVATPTAVARLRFGFRTQTSQPPGSYVAPVTFTVIAP